MRIEEVGETWLDFPRGRWRHVNGAFVREAMSVQGLLHLVRKRRQHRRHDDDVHLV